MANISRSALLNFYLNEAAINAPLGWMDIEILATFDDEGVQANVTTEEFTFVNEAKQAIKQYILNGLSGGTGIFEGLPFRIEAVNNRRQTTVLDAYLDLANESEDLINSNRFSSRIGISGGVNSFMDRASGLSFESIYQDGFITDADFIDVDYVVEKPIDPVEIITLGIAIYVIFKEAKQQLFEITKLIADIAAHAGGGLPGPIAAAIFSGVVLAARIVLFGFILDALIDLSRTIINVLVPPRRTHKASTYRTLLNAIAAALGYSFSSTVAELDTYVYLPSNRAGDVLNDNGFITKAGTIKRGIPNSADFGYLANEMMGLAREMFNGKFAIEDQTLVFEWKESEYWERKSNYVLPDVLIESIGYNTNELKPTKILSFQTDLSDEWTIDNFRGTSYQINTRPIAVSRQENVLLKGFEQVNFNTALGTVKDRLNPIEKIAETILGLVDSLARVIFKRTNFKGSISGKIGLLKVTNNYHALPKTLLLENNRIPSNHRNLLSAKYLYEKYHFSESFVLRDNINQKILYRNVEIPFGLEDFVVLIKNNYAKTTEGKEARIEKISWQMGMDTATVDFYIKEAYTKNLQENYNEPE